MPRGGGSCCPVYWALTIELCGLEHPAVCLRPTPAPARASLHPHPEPGSSPGPAKEASWTGRGACHTHAARGWLCASGMREARVMAAGPAPAAPALPPGTSTSNCSNRPRCLLIAIATAAHVLLGGGRPAWRAGGQKGIWLRQAVQVQPHLGAPPSGLQGGQTPVPGDQPATPCCPTPGPLLLRQGENR